MRIELEEPFVEDYKAAYVNTNKEPRRVCLLVRNDGTQTSMSYARYLMSCHLGRLLLPEEHVDHIDNDKMNDIISNYQILTKKDNIKKSAKGRKVVTLICPVCKLEFTRFHNRVSHKNNPTCSRKCGSIKGHPSNNY